MNTTLLIFLRIVHVFGSVMWVGSAILYLFLIGPAARASGPAGQSFMMQFIGRQRYPIYMNTVAMLTILSGIPLIWNMSGGFNLAWLQTGPGLGFTIGAAAGIAVFFFGFIVLKPRGEKLGALGVQMGRAGGPPTAAQVAQIDQLNKEIHQAEWVDFVLLAIALLTMATARYWIF